MAVAAVGRIATNFLSTVRRRAAATLQLWLFVMMTTKRDAPSHPKNTSKQRYDELGGRARCLSIASRRALTRKNVKIARWRDPRFSFFSTTRSPVERRGPAKKMHQASE
jgi:hypothetical protein